MSNLTGLTLPTSQRIEVVTQLIGEILPSFSSVKIERVLEGASTEVYRVWHDSAVLYLRVLPEEDASFAPEALVHTMLCERGLRVPEVVYVAHNHPLLQRSVMLTTAIEGQAVAYGSSFRGLRNVIVRVGQELAAINRIPVDGFGWIRRDIAGITALHAPFPTCRTWLANELDGVLAMLYGADVLEIHEARAIEGLFVRDAGLLNETQAYLAHGDFDVTHIYHQHGHYSGIIDFGEIRGANGLYDLGHFAIEHSELLPWLLEGYQQVASLPDDYMQQIVLTSLCIALKRLYRRVNKGSGSVYVPDLQTVRRAIKSIQR